MVTVGNVAHRNGFERLADSFDFGVIVDNPNRVAKAVTLAHEVIHRLTLGHCTEHIELALIAVGQEHRTGVGVGGKHMAQTVFFLVGASEFVLLDNAVKVVSSGHAANETVLFAAVHGLAVNIEARLLVVSDHAVGNHLVQVFASMRIDLRVVSIHGIREFQFRTGHAQVGMREPFGHGLGLGAVHHVVREGRNRFGFGRIHRAQRLERVNVHHRVFSFVCCFN